MNGTETVKRVIVYSDQFDQRRVVKDKKLQNYLFSTREILHESLLEIVFKALQYLVFFNRQVHFSD